MMQNNFFLHMQQNSLQFKHIAVVLAFVALEFVTQDDAV
jgi:hypothetical protein